MREYDTIERCLGSVIVRTDEYDGILESLPLSESNTNRHIKLNTDIISASILMPYSKTRRRIV